MDSTERLSLAKEFMFKRYTLESLFGLGWEALCIKNALPRNLENIFKYSRQFSPRKPESNLPLLSLYNYLKFLNPNFELFQVIHADFPQHVLIKGKIGEDTFYFITKPGNICNANSQNPETYTFTPTKFGIISKTGNVLILDDLIRAGKNKKFESSVVFVLSRDLEYQAKLGNAWLDQVDSTLVSKITTPFITNIEGILTFFHELGHIRTFSQFSQLKFLHETRSDFVNHYIVFPPGPTITRGVISTSERSAHAIGISISKFLHRKYGFDFGSEKNLKIMMRVSQEALLTYENNPLGRNSKDVKGFTAEARRKERRVKHYQNHIGKILFQRVINFLKKST